MKRTIVISLAALLVGVSLFSSQTTALTAVAPTINGQITAVPLFRLYHKDSGIHFYTIDTQRKLEAISAGWTLEGTQAYVFGQQAPGTIPLLALKMTIHGVNVYEDVFGFTASAEERDELLHAPALPEELGGFAAPDGPSIWRVDGGGVACYIAPKQLPGTVPLYKLYHPADLPNTNRRYCVQNEYDNWYTTSQNEMTYAVGKQGYTYRGIIGYVWQHPITLDPEKQIPNNTGGQPALNVDTDLLNRGCFRSGFGGYNCPTVAGYEACQSYKTRGLVKQCYTSANLSEQEVMETMLFSAGCNRFLGRPDQFICKTQKALDFCEGYRARGQTTKCLRAK